MPHDERAFLKDTKNLSRRLLSLSHMPGTSWVLGLQNPLTWTSCMWSALPWQGDGHNSKPSEFVAIGM